ncbi:MAG: 4Fe-4S ferredoxin [Promethearchaeota archaeon]|nr:MAG: 4Fe-4S ferredoxin [Candidatus Lokiarchaeota archaeon]
MVNVEEIRVGVFVCHCGSNIGGIIDCKKLAEYSRTLPSVVYSEDNLYTCSENGLKSIKNAIKEHDLNRVVVASCTPRTHEPLFRDTIEEAGMNKYLFNFINIRDQCTWVHSKSPNEAYRKAEDLVRMGVAKAVKLEPLEDIVVDINHEALVIGGGVAGMKAAVTLSKFGYKTYLIEKKRHLGGRLKSLYKVFPNDEKASEIMNDLVREIKDSDNIIVFYSSEIDKINGFIGNYDVYVKHSGNSENLKVGVIIVAVGSQVFKPIGIFGYDGKKRITQLELEKNLQNNEIDAKNVVMIQCVGAKNEKREYCSNVCCMTAMKNALILKEKCSDINITILFRDLFTPGVVYEDYYNKSRENGILFSRYTLENPPVVESDKVRVFNQSIGGLLEIPYDLLVLSTPMVANEDNSKLAQQLKVPLEKNKFFLEAHVKLRPVDFATDGIYIAGSAKWPVSIAESISQGLAAASRANTILSHAQIEVEGATATLPEWNKDLCKGCEVCIEICPYNAIKKNEDDEIIIIKALCKGCGVCGATCTKKAITIKHFTNEQINSEILALGGLEIK